MDAPFGARTPGFGGIERKETKLGGKSPRENNPSWPDLIRPSMQHLGLLHGFMDARVKPGHDEKRKRRSLEECRPWLRLLIGKEI
jgi:hypothetical protein